MAQTVNLTKIEVRYVPAAKIGEVYLKATLGHADGFINPADMDLVDMPGINAHRRSASHPKNLETVYKHYQSIDGTPDERTAQLKVRSMSVGDALIVKGKCFYVAPTGFVTKDAEGNLVPVDEDNCESK